MGTVIEHRQAHGSLYFSDGNIVLTTVGSTGEHVLFRVHQSILAKNSPVFEHMLSSPGDANETYDGVPLVQLSDSREDWESLLGILYHDITLPLKRLDPNTPSLVRGVLSIANKYGMDRLRQQVVLRLEADWPQSLWQWDCQEAEIRAMGLTWDEKGGGLDLPYLDDHLPEPVSTIALARDYVIPSLLPSAFYHLSRLSIYDDRRTTRTLEDGGNNSYSEGLLDGQRTADWILLSSMDYMCLLKGRLGLSCASQSLFSVTQVGHRQHSNDTCLLLWQVSLLTEIREACRRSSDPLETARRHLEQGRFGDQVCTMCCSYIQKELQAFRSMVWTKLPEYFGLQ